MACSRECDRAAGSLGDGRVVGCSNDVGLKLEIVRKPYMTRVRGILYIGKRSLLIFYVLS